MKTASKRKGKGQSTLARRRRVALARPESRQVAIQAPPTIAESIEKVLIGGDLSPLSPEERVQYHNAVCKSIGLNPLTGPFLYILFRETEGAPAKLQLYATKDAAAQLRKIHRVSVLALRREIRDSMSTVEADVQDGFGKRDSAIGVVPLWKWKNGKREDLTGREYANAIMKTETKAKRRATLSVCGLAFLDESELDTMQIVGGVTRDGRIFEYKQPQLPEASEPVSLQEGADLHDKAVELARAEKDSELPFKQLVAQKEKELKSSPPVKHEAPAEKAAASVESHAKPTGDNAAADSLFYVETPSGLYELLGSDVLLKAHKSDLLTFLDQPASKAARARLLQPEQLGKLLGWCERSKVPIRALESSNAEQKSS